MKLLAFETSTKTCSIALLEDEVVIAEEIFQCEKSHSEVLLPLVDKLLSKCKTSIKYIDVLGGACGPGSFTSLRVSLSTIKAFAHAHQKKVVGVSTLEALSMNGRTHNGIVCPVMDARRAELYTAFFAFSDGAYPKRKSPDAILTIDALVEKLPKNRPILMVGNEILALKERLKSAELDFKWASLTQPLHRASHVGLLSFRQAQLGKTSDSNDLHPNYIRLPAAQVHLKKSR